MTDIESRVVERFVAASMVSSRVRSDDPETNEALQWMIKERDRVIRSFDPQLKKIVKERGDQLEEVQKQGVEKFPNAVWTEVMRLLVQDDRSKGRS